MGQELAGLKSCAWLPEFCSRTFEVLCEGSSTGSLLCEAFHTTSLQNPKGSAEFWGGEGEPGPVFLSTGFFSFSRSTMWAEIVAYIICLEGLEYPEYVMHIFT